MLINYSGETKKHLKDWQGGGTHHTSLIFPRDTANLLQQKQQVTFLVHYLPEN